MRGLVPRIHVFFFDLNDVDGRDKPGHDDEKVRASDELRDRQRCCFYGHRC